MSTSHDHAQASGGMTATSKSLVLSGLVIVALAGAIWYLLPASEKPATAEQPPAAPAAVGGPVGPRRGLRPGAGGRDLPFNLRRNRLQHPTLEGTERGREKFAAELQQRLARKNRAVSVDAQGPGYRVLRLRWTPGKVDREHLEQLQQAQPLFREARGMGFGQVVMLVGERVVWQKSL